MLIIIIYQFIILLLLFVQRLPVVAQVVERVRSGRWVVQDRLPDVGQVIVFYLDHRQQPVTFKECSRYAYHLNLIRSKMITFVRNGGFLNMRNFSLWIFCPESIWKSRTCSTKMNDLPLWRTAWPCSKRIYDRWAGYWGKKKSGRFVHVVPMKCKKLNKH